MDYNKSKSMTYQQKLNLIETVENGKSLREVSEELNISRNTLNYILKNKDKIRSEINKKPGLVKQKRFKQTKNPEIETAVLKYIYGARHRGEKVTGNIIKSVALETALKMNIQDFAASNGWLFSFFKRNAISITDFNKSSETKFSTSMIENLDETNEEEQIHDMDTSFDSISNIIKEEREEDDVEEDIEKEDEDFTEFVNVAMNEDSKYTAQWKNWCRLCGNTEAMIEFDSQLFGIIVQFFEVQSNDDIKICVNCNNTLELTSKLIFKGKLVESMFLDLEERDRLNYLTDTKVSKIRLEYGIDEIEDSHLLHEFFDADTKIEKTFIDESEKNFEVDTKYDNVEDDEQLVQEIVYEEQYLDEDPIEYEVVEEEKLDDGMKKDKTAKTMKLLEEDSFVFDCHVCHKNFERMCFLSNHTREAHNCLPQVACTCGKYLATWDSLMAHKRKHSSSLGSWVCDFCGGKFITKTGLSIHIKFKHERPPPEYICAYCKKEYKDSTSLKAHEKTHFPDFVKPTIQCDICFKTLSSKYSLKHHIISVHEQQKTMLCHICTKGFSNKSNLRSHLISHMTENVKCEVCNSVFKNRVSLQSHKKIHKPKESLNFPCPECDKRFHNRNHLERHFVSHTDIRNYKCPMNGCEMAYKWEKDLKNHMACHLGDRKHKCLWCDRSFIDSANLRKHKLRYHPSELAKFEKKFGKSRQMKNILRDGEDLQQNLI